MAALLLPLLFLTGAQAQPTPPVSRTAGKATPPAVQDGRTSKPVRSASPTPPPLGGYRYLRAATPRPAAQPGERILLSLDTGHGRQNYTLSQLQALPTMRYTTFHPHLQRSFTYEGVPLRDLAVAAGYLGSDLRLYAENGYVTTIRARDYLDAPLLLAYRADNRAISALQKGPLTLVLPPDPRRFPLDTYEAAWVWFVNRVTAAP